ncbi:MAG: hypothetical protein LIP04_12180 [Tannerellaceae bacterium]|nr:hypothetical protein [Tannerellaceae bacterium]
MIPKIIHQIWEGCTEHLGDVYQSLGETWREHHPDWTYEFWDENRMENLVYDHFPELLDIYFGYPYPVQRWQMIRYLILYQMGGIYVDFDYECLAPFDPYITDESICYFAMEPEQHLCSSGQSFCIHNALMITPWVIRFSNM